MSLIDIDNFEGLYKFDKDLNRVYNINTGKYIKNSLNNKNYCVYLYKDGKQKKFTLNHLIYKYNNQDNNQDDFVDIIEYEGLYKLNLKTNQVINKNTGKCIKNTLDKGYNRISLFKNGKKKSFQLHRLIFQAHNPSIDIIGSDIDHINQNKLDNNINNLRIATRSENQCNSKVYKNNKSTGIKNIYKNKSNIFTVVITKDEKNHSKRFKTLEEAIIHRDLKLTEIHGEFACF